jgi:hypothetical protein
MLKKVDSLLPTNLLPATCADDLRTALHHLDEVRRAAARKFLCLNDDGMSAGVRGALRDFLRAAYPRPSQFELGGGGGGGGASRGFNPEGVRMPRLRQM